ncbi:MAG TPA: hypothetical protein PLD54_01455 [Candidatus Levybacteria bacterium]|nr:hypothetical protein [Candidatus Levybacteria bacterium]
MKEKKKESTTYIGVWTGIGIALGSGLGVALDNLGLGIVIGTILGVTIDSVRLPNKKNKK